MINAAWAAQMERLTRRLQMVANRNPDSVVTFRVIISDGMPVMYTTPEAVDLEPSSDNVLGAILKAKGGDSGGT